MYVYYVNYRIYTYFSWGFGHEKDPALRAGSLKVYRRPAKRVPESEHYQVRFLWRLDFKRLRRL